MGTRRSKILIFEDLPCAWLDGGIRQPTNLTGSTNSDVQSLFLVNIWRERDKTRHQKPQFEKIQIFLTSVWVVPLFLKTFSNIKGTENFRGGTLCFLSKDCLSRTYYNWYALLFMLWGMDLFHCPSLSASFRCCIRCCASTRKKRDYLMLLLLH